MKAVTVLALITMIAFSMAQTGTQAMAQSGGPMPPPPPPGFGPPPGAGPSPQGGPDGPGGRQRPHGQPPHGGPGFGREEGPPPGMGGGHGGQDLEALIQNLGLSTEQKDKLRQSMVSFRNNSRQTRMSLNSLNDEKQTLIMAGKVDLDKIAKIDDEIVKLSAEIMRERFKMQRDRMSILTPEQITKLAEFLFKKGRRNPGDNFSGNGEGGGLRD